MPKYLKEFVSSETAPGLLLIAATILALLCSNTPLVGFYQMLLDTRAQVLIGGYGLSKPLLLWINDGLMAVFFLMVGLELKREMVEGELSQPSHVILPVVGAIGGMLVPALIYAAFNYTDPISINGWAIPSATDIAFSLGVLAMLGTRVPTSIKLFLVTLAIIDDLGAIIIIAIFYTEDLSLSSLVVASFFILVLLILNRKRVMTPTPYLLVGMGLWFAVLKSGVHATLAGVVLAFFLPMRTADGKTSPVDDLEHALNPTVMFGILPIFAFANAGVSLAGITTAASWNSVSLGIIFGLLIGKPLGIFGFCFALIKTGLAKLPSGSSFAELFGVALLCGIGFTMSLFIGSLAFANAEIAVTGDRLGILTGSLVSALAGYFWLNKVLPEKSEELQT